MNYPIEEILKDCDPDIKEMMLADAPLKPGPEGQVYKNWMVIQSPELVALTWQTLRDMKKKHVKK